MRDLLIEKLELAFSRIFSDILLSKAEIEINYPPEEFGDYSTNLALKIAKKIGKNPREIAEIIKNELEKDDAEKDIFSEIKVAGAGFLNFNLSAKARGLEIEKINSAGGNYGDGSLGKDKKIHLDFVSANPTGPIHLGNGRGGPLGDMLANILIKNKNN